jgi:hypothetical protein
MQGCQIPLRDSVLPNPLAAVPQPPSEDEEPDEVAPEATIRNAWSILALEDAVQKVDPNHWTVASPRRPGKRVGVLRRGTLWRCRDDHWQDPHPCSHVLAARYYEGDLVLPGAPQPANKEERPRNKSAEARSWREQPQLLPLLLARLLRAAVPVLERPDDPTKKGRPYAPLYPCLYQSVIRATFRYSLGTAEGFMLTPEHREHNPYQPLSRSTISRFNNDPTTSHTLTNLLALSTWPARPYDVIHTTEAALTHYYFKLFFGDKPTDKDRPAPRTWAQILWSHNYNLIVATRIQTGYFGEEWTGSPITDGAVLMLDKQPDPADTSTCRAHAGAGTATLKRHFRKQLYGATPMSQKNELLCRAIGHNLTRLIYLGIDKSVDIQFDQGAHLLKLLEANGHATPAA